MKWILITAVMATGLLVGDIPSVNKTNPTVASSSSQSALVTSQYDWLDFRTVTASDTPLDSTTRAWSTVGTLFKRIPYGYNSVFIAAYADGDSTGEGDPNGGSFSYKIFTCKRNCSARLIGTGTWAVGELALSHDPAKVTATVLTYGVTDPNSSKFCELPVVSTSTGGSPIAVGTTNDIGMIELDVKGDYAIWVEVTSLSNITNLHLLLSGY